MNETKEKFAALSSETLSDMAFPPRKCCVETLLPQGVCILGGAPKIGKSWMVLDLCLRVAKGEPIWNLKTNQGTTLYLALEDTRQRMSDRINKITDDPPLNAFCAVAAGTLEEGLETQIRNFKNDYPDLTLLVIDTFQIIRRSKAEVSYANDYEEVRKLKSIADELHITILLVHHLRKQGDSDPLNKLSGSTGLVGAMDAVFVLDKSKRNAQGATLVCAGRDFPYRELELKLTKDCIWELLSDSLEEPQKQLPKELEEFVLFAKTISPYDGGNTELITNFNAFCKQNFSVKGFKQRMKQWRTQLQEQGVIFNDYRSNGKRKVEIFYCDSNLRNESAVSDETKVVCDTCDSCVPCVPDSDSMGDFSEDNDEVE